MPPRRWPTPSGRPHRCRRATKCDRPASPAGARSAPRRGESRPGCASARRAPDVREQEQHQQRAAARGDVDAPGEKSLLSMLVFPWEADIDVPAGVAGIVRAGNRTGKVPRPPAAASVRFRRAGRRRREARGVGGRPERRRVIAEADDRPGPGRGSSGSQPRSRHRMARPVRPARAERPGRSGRSRPE